MPPNSSPHSTRPQQHTQHRPLLVLISGGGSNLKAILEAERSRNWRAKFNASVQAVISDRHAVGGLAIAENFGVASLVVPRKEYANQAEFETALSHQIKSHKPYMLILAGFMRILSPHFVERYRIGPQRLLGGMLNIHPSLLPAFPGLHTHKKALDAGCRFAGATVHRVLPALDSGPILGQVVVPVLATDTPQTLAARVLTQEHLLYPRVIESLLK